ncbi:MAG: class I SAM-dependent methyltransferase [Rickettsiaceae bacterium]|nr:class I SAM-dependent methyltransferase [Rickettsiaceae bacterium]
MTQQNTYDAMPYESSPYPVSSPPHLKTIGTLFGLKPEALENSRVLELGCSSGGNIMPFAYLYPKSECIGVDLSPVQIATGKELVEKLGIKNLELKCMSIMDIDESFGKFDYIIAHGVFSWVPENVREKILEISNKNLNENGIVYISYNTLPGWNMIKSIRDMMLYHTKNFANPQEKVQQARLLLEFLRDSNENNTSPYSALLTLESSILSEQPDYYLKHDHLEEDNEAFYFHDFMNLASNHQLQYLGDATIATMFLGNLPQKVSDKLAEIKDIVRTEQYMDYISNRRFRSSLLCKNTLTLNRALTHNDLLKFYIRMVVNTETSLDKIDIENDLEPIVFYFNNRKDVTATIKTKCMKAVFYTMTENRNMYFSVDELAALAIKKLKHTTLQDMKNEILQYGMSLVLSGHIIISADKPTYQTKIDKKPVVSELARVQSMYSTNPWVTNLRHERVGISDLDKYIMKYLDGKNSISEIKQKLTEFVQKGEIVFSKENININDQNQVAKEIDLFINNYLNNLRDTALLI